VLFQYIEGLVVISSLFCYGLNFDNIVEVPVLTRDSLFLIVEVPVLTRDSLFLLLR